MKMLTAYYNCSSVTIQSTQKVKLRLTYHYEVIVSTVKHMQTDRYELCILHFLLSASGITVMICRLAVTIPLVLNLQGGSYGATDQSADARAPITKNAFLGSLILEYICVIDS